MPEHLGPIILAVFARANHPRGYGYGAPGEAYGTAHGYIVIVVQCEDGEELAKVEERMRKYPIPNAAPANSWNGPRFDPWNRGDEWYAGPYELVWAAPAAVHDTGLTASGSPFPIGTALSYGDNRACAYLTAAEVLSG